MSNSTELFLASTSDLGIPTENDERTFDPYKILHERAPSAMSNPACAMALGLARLNVADRVGALDRMPTGPFGAIRQLTGMVGGFVGGSVSGMDFVGYVTDNMGRVGYTTDNMGRVQGGAPGASQRSRVGYTTDGYGFVQGLTDDNGFSNSDPNAVNSSPVIPEMTASNQGGLDSFFGQLGPNSPLMPATPLDPNLLGPLPGDPGGIQIPDVSPLPPGIPQGPPSPQPLPKAQPMPAPPTVAAKKSSLLVPGLLVAGGLAAVFHKQLGF